MYVARQRAACALAAACSVWQQGMAAAWHGWPSSSRRLAPRQRQQQRLAFASAGLDRRVRNHPRGDHLEESSAVLGLVGGYPGSPPASSYLPAPPPACEILSASPARTCGGAPRLVVVGDAAAARARRAGNATTAPHAHHQPSGERARRPGGEYS